MDNQKREYAPNLIGRVFGELKVIARAPRRVGSTAAYWDCICSCGAGVAVSGRHLRSGKARSCGCLRGKCFETHKLSAHPLYKRWVGMVRRCEDPKAVNYGRYGARGIFVCDRWKDVAKFIEDMGPGWREGLTLDRIDGAAGYSPDNGRWVTPKEQAANAKHNRWVNTPNGPMLVCHAAEWFGVPQTTFLRWLRKGDLAERMGWNAK